MLAKGIEKLNDENDHKFDNVNTIIDFFERALNDRIIKSFECSKIDRKDDTIIIKSTGKDNRDTFNGFRLTPEALFSVVSGDLKQYIKELGKQR
jgi:hypothetical protein